MQTRFLLAAYSKMQKERKLKKLLNKRETKLEDLEIPSLYRFPKKMRRYVLKKTQGCSWTITLVIRRSPINLIHRGSGGQECDKIIQQTLPVWTKGHRKAIRFGVFYRVEQ